MKTKLFVLLVCGFSLAAPMTAQAVTCTQSDIAAYKRLENTVEANFDKCIAAAKRNSSKLCSICKPMHDSMWKAERWRDTHNACIEQDKKNLAKVREMHNSTRKLDSILKECGF